MGKITKIECDLDNDQLTKKIKETKGFWKVQKWLIIYNAKNYPCKAGDLAKHLNVSKSLVHKTIYEYKKYGEASIEKKGKGGRWHSYMSYEEEEEFIKPFIDSATEGEIATIDEIKKEFENKIDEIEFTGLDGGGCVALTALGALKNSFKVIINEAAVGTMFVKKAEKYKRILINKGTKFIQ